MSEARVILLLENALEELRLLRESVGRRLPRVLTMKAAAGELSISKRKLQGLLAKGVLRSVTIDGRRMVPSSEIERLATPQQKPTRRTQSRPASRHPAEAAAAVREFLKRQ